MNEYTELKITIDGQITVIDGYNTYDYNNYNHHLVYNSYITIIITNHYGSSAMISLTDPRINFEYTTYCVY